MSNSKSNQIDDIKVHNCDMICHLVTTKEIIAGG